MTNKFRDGMVRAWAMLGIGWLCMAGVPGWKLHAQVVEEVLLPSGSDWEYLLYSVTDGLETPVDPVTVDPDFHTTWMNTSAYDGPAFSGPAPAMLGYGYVGNPNLVVTDIWDWRNGVGVPPARTRYTAYFRTTFTPSVEPRALRFTGLVDDGCFIYLDGVLVGTINMLSTAIDEWMTTRSGRV